MLRGNGLQELGRGSHGKGMNPDMGKMGIDPIGGEGVVFSVRQEENGIDSHAFMQFFHHLPGREEMGASHEFQFLDMGYGGVDVGVIVKVEYLSTGRATNGGVAELDDSQNKLIEFMFFETAKAAALECKVIRRFKTEPEYAGKAGHVQTALLQVNDYSGLVAKTKRRIRQLGRWIAPWFWF